MNPATESFIHEAGDLLQGLEAMLLELETTSDPEQIDAVFRALHTVKGSSGMFGFGALSRFTHHFENAFDLVREGKLAADRRLIDLSLAARDHMMALLQTGGDGPEAERLEKAPVALKLIAALVALTNQPPLGPQQVVVKDLARPASTIRVFEIWFRPNGEALHNGMRPDLLVDELRGLGEIHLRIDADSVPPLESLDVGYCYLGFSISLTTDRLRSAIESIFIFADDADLQIVETAASVAAAAGPELPATSRAGPSGLATTAKDADRSVESKPRKAANTSGESVRVPSARLPGWSRSPVASPIRCWKVWSRKWSVW